MALNQIINESSNDCQYNWIDVNTAEHVSNFLLMDAIGEAKRTCRNDINCQQDITLLLLFLLLLFLLLILQLLPLLLLLFLFVLLLLSLILLLLLLLSLL